MARPDRERSAAEVDLIVMGDAPVPAAGEQGEALAPAGGFQGDKAVVVPFDQPDHKVCGGEVDIGKGRFHHAGIALVENAGHIRVFLVEAPGVVGGKVPADGKEIGLCVPDEADPVVHGEGRHVEEGIRRFQEPVNGLGAPVRGADGGDAGDGGTHPQGGGGHAGLQPALGVGDDVDLFRPRLVQDLADPGLDGFGVFLHPGPAVLLAVIELRTHGGERSRDTAPVEGPFQIPKAHAVEQEDGIFGDCAAIHGGSFPERCLASGSTIPQ